MSFKDAIVSKDVLCLQDKKIYIKLKHGVYIKAKKYYLAFIYFFCFLLWIYIVNDFVFMFWQSCTSIVYSHLHVLPSLLCVFPPSVSDLCALALGFSALTLASFPAALDVQKLHLIKTFILLPILLCQGCRHGSIAISLIDNSVCFVR